MNVVLLSHTISPEELCAIAAKTCYSNDPAHEIELELKDQKRILDRTIDSGHESIMEHAYFTFSISGVSRVLTHQLVRHRMASYSQQSQRYMALNHPSYITPPSVDTNTKDDDDNLQMQLFDHAMTAAWESYNKLIDIGIPAEDARYVLPGACCTNIVVTMNARELCHFFELRMCSRAQWEIRDLANAMHAECMKIAPELFKRAGPNCWKGGCRETKPCGNPSKRGC